MHVRLWFVRSLVAFIASSPLSLFRAVAASHGEKGKKRKNQGRNKIWTRQKKKNTYIYPEKILELENVLPSSCALRVLTVAFES